MSHGQNLRDLLAPLGVYRWEGSFQWGELQSEGEALDQVAEQVALLQREMNLYTAQAEGADRTAGAAGTGARRGDLGRTAPDGGRAASHWGGQLYPGGHERYPPGLWNPGPGGGDGGPAGGGGFLSRCGGIPAGFEQTKARIEEILPCHLLVKYQFSDSV